MDRNQIRGSDIRQFYLEIHSQQPLKNGKAAIEVGLMNGGKVPHSRRSPSGLTLISFASAAKVGSEPRSTITYD
jgi:hypothetical protein